ncbi:MAG: MazG nucleotide pyrophosphohydrolase domain-containing protein [Candidatus Micrarchaeota archaeon]
MRPELTSTQMSQAMGEAQDWLFDRIKEKGKGSFSSTHEIRGVMDEEYNELREAMHQKDIDAIAHELKDIFVGAVFALACLRSGYLEW